MEAVGSSPETVEVAGASPNAPTTSDQATAQRKTGKRDRVALACQRCKTRKQKCDGQRPACASCARLSLKCVPLVPAAGEKKLYIKALEQRVAELESALASLGHLGVGNDHLRGMLGASSSFSQQAGVSGSPSGIGSQQLRQDSEDDGNDILNAVRDLSLSASGHYVGASSNITIGRVLSSVVHSQRNTVNPGIDDLGAQDEDDPAPKSVYSTRLTDVVGEPFLSPNVAHRLLEGWFRHTATRYPVLHTANVMDLHNNRENLANDYDKSILHLIYAISGRWLESAGEMGHFFSDQHYDAAFENMDTILQLRDSRTVDYLLLMALYCTRAPRDPGAWTYVRAAMQLCIELGLHRRPRRQVSSVEGEMHKRRFWTTYFLDRDISIAIGRPPSISDHDIDADLPLDINEDTRSDDIVRQAAIHVSNIPSNPATTLTSFIHRLRLKRIESEIQHVVYRVDQSEKVTDATIRSFLDQLNLWNDSIPFEARNFAHQPNTAYDGLEFYTIHYHRCVRFLLYPSLAEVPVNMHYLKLCADACAGIISDYRRLHHVFPVGFSALSIQSMFLAGLTLIYCAWLAPVNYISVDAPLTDCQLLLYIVTERYPSARKYRDVFERIKRAILDLIAQGKHEPRNPVHLEPAVQESVSKFQGQWGGGMAGMGSDFSFMINTMTGNAAATPPFDIGMDPTATSLIGSQPQQASDLGQFQQMWHGMPHVPDGMGDLRGMFQ
ncbi:hypothetical protein JX265_009004 [Neoarthrinium moseri]|uniref:Zn(2)-C6 fungal-type domain-containing protein n=1 Tax=Neoarthrinium moseri TaxID=1658444 RepID=A0A9Q0ALN9_9PEZI|nr:uncharacterized protein JN550_007874 [Neoarthrinium moseri]KAI1846693.1 hypothetical protein JX266_007266 [Neoarthrinium moseri]KAI1862958.1 hypothetical protein JX265_009004 [Neoarthrinium moseri]KAI1866185.1 hypothetical protein JN550_007874 [Neoarthrinium moseri]